MKRGLIAFGVAIVLVIILFALKAEKGLEILSGPKSIRIAYLPNQPKPVVDLTLPIVGRVTLPKPQALDEDARVLLSISPGSGVLYGLEPTRAPFRWTVGDQTFLAERMGKYVVCPFTFGNGERSRLLDRRGNEVLTAFLPGNRVSPPALADRVISSRGAQFRFRALPPVWADGFYTFELVVDGDPNKVYGAYVAGTGLLLCGSKPGYVRVLPRMGSVPFELGEVVLKETTIRVRRNKNMVELIRPDGAIWKRAEVGGAVISEIPVESADEAITNVPSLPLDPLFEVGVELWWPNRPRQDPSQDRLAWARLKDGEAYPAMEYRFVGEPEHAMIDLVPRVRKAVPAR